jgi:serine/threonine-protein kinase
MGPGSDARAEKPAAAVPKAAKVASAPPSAPAEAKPATKPVVVAAAPQSAPAAAKTTASRIELAVAPWGEVFVDGKSRGVSPPLRTLELSPGSHTIEIRNSTFPARVEKVVVKPGDAVKIRHRFK